MEKNIERFRGKAKRDTKKKRVEYKEAMKTLLDKLAAKDEEIKNLKNAEVTLEDVRKAAEGKVLLNEQVRRLEQREDEKDETIHVLKDACRLLEQTVEAQAAFIGLKAVGPVPREEILHKYEVSRETISESDEDKKFSITVNTREE